ncbi:hypothetical protein SDC9_151988 [bioreactor metagenome]|uniref:Uncharacterized protein n=1 Tax=bioreactor metagenome TaxID=1076179 RepID=A0A645ERV2_9ZZZZ
MLKSEQKEQILKLRKEGYGYKSIASILQISRDSVRNECKKHNLTGYGQKVQEDIAEPISINMKCLYCQKEINKVEQKGRRAKFCSDKCRRTWWNEHPECKDKKESAWYTFTCGNCGKEFKAYGNKNRKFCSIRCSTEYRFGSATQNEEVLFYVEDGRVK